MISLNLLSPAEKLDASLKWNYLIVRNIVIMLLVLAIIISGILHAAKIALTNHADDIRRQAELISAEHLGANNRINTINSIITELQTIQNSYKPVNPVMNAILADIPDGIQLTNFRLDVSSQQVILVGKAETRDSLLQLESQLKQNQIVKDIEVPLSNLLQKSNINFNLVGTLVIE